ncbi:hypothetical protein BDV96DRAFT_601265 [Lophiotrema nucula]|uniref:Uncharacterized protein n=1 Tax=Lophiotrema nucula TaxID=690887 RepID=A0A6A5Z2Y4_9PLEO|nr:hypothetical protein BDV96DRAFT_601265 [Lophiotrema nucula]
MSDKRLDSSHTLSVPETPLPLTTQKTQNIEPQPNVAPTHTSTRFRPSPLHRTLSSQRIAELAPAPRPSFLARLSSRKVPTISEFPRPPTPPLPELPLLDEQGMAEHEAKTKKAWELQSVALGQISAHPYPRCVVSKGRIQWRSASRSGTFSGVLHIRLALSLGASSVILDSFLRGMGRRKGRVSLQIMRHGDYEALRRSSYATIRRDSLELFFIREREHSGTSSEHKIDFDEALG